MTIHTSDRGQALAPTIGEKPVSGATASFLTLTLGSIGVVFGDIGTSPLYAFREAVVAATATGVVSRVAVLGVLSLILWALIIVVTCKYVLILLRADNNGEGGTLSLTALASRAFGRRVAPIYILGVIGASMFLEDWADYAGHFGVVGGRGIEARDARLRALRHRACRRHPRRAVRGPESGAPS